MEVWDNVREDLDEEEAELEDNSNEFLNLSELPEEILMAILQMLAMEDLCETSKVNKHLHQLSRDDALWKPFCNTDWRTSPHER